MEKKETNKLLLSFIWSAYGIDSNNESIKLVSMSICFCDDLEYRYREKWTIIQSLKMKGMLI